MTKSPSRKPPAEFEMECAVVRRLLVAQHPDLAALPIEPAESGWDNDIFRLGDLWAVRLPRRLAAVPLIEREQRWIGSLPKLPFRVPTPIRVGCAGEGFPWPWSIVPWLPGATADVAAPDESQAVPLAAFLAALHVVAPPDAPKSSVRGIPLTERAAVVERRLRRLEGKTSLITPMIWKVWSEALEAAQEGMATWIHGDLHARNVLVEHGQICAVVDWGDMTAGDRATDLASFWMLLPSVECRFRAMLAYPGMTEPLLARSRGWAIALGALLLESGLEDDPRQARMGELTLRRVAEDVGRLKGKNSV